MTYLNISKSEESGVRERLPAEIIFNLVSGIVCCFDVFSESCLMLFPFFASLVIGDERRGPGTSGSSFPANSYTHRTLKSYRRLWFYYSTH